MELRARGVRRRRGGVSVTYVDDGRECPPRVAFAVNRRVGSAVVRNRIRRRTRAALNELARENPVPKGAYLITLGAEVVALPYEELNKNVRSALEAVGAASHPTEPRA